MTILESTNDFEHRREPDVLKGISTMLLNRPLDTDSKLIGPQHIKVALLTVQS